LRWGHGGSTASWTLLSTRRTKGGQSLENRSNNGVFLSHNGLDHPVGSFLRGATPFRCGLSRPSTNKTWALNGKVSAERQFAATGAAAQGRRGRTRGQDQLDGGTRGTRSTGFRRARDRAWGASWGRAVGKGERGGGGAFGATVNTHSIGDAMRATFEVVRERSGGNGRVGSSVSPIRRWGRSPDRATAGHGEGVVL
jgi:hypothetical protein